MWTVAMPRAPANPLCLASLTLPVGFSPDAFLGAVVNETNDALSNAVDELERNLMTEVPAKQEHWEAVRAVRPGRCKMFSLLVCLVACCVGPFV